MLKTLCTRPLHVAGHVFTGAKLEFVVRVLRPVGFLPVFAPAHLLLALPTFLQSILSELPAQYSIHYQYTAPMIPFVFVSAVFGCRRLARALRSRAAVKPGGESATAMSILVLFVLLFFGKSPIHHLRRFRPDTHAREVARHLREIPPDAAVSAQCPLVPHLSRRAEIYMFPDVKNAEYVVLDSSMKKWPLEEDAYRKKVDELLAGDYEVVRRVGSLVVLISRRSSAFRRKPPPGFSRAFDGRRSPRRSPAGRAPGAGGAEAPPKLPAKAGTLTVSRRFS